MNSWKKTYVFVCTKKCPVKEFLDMNSYIHSLRRFIHPATSEGDQAACAHTIRAPQEKQSKKSNNYFNLALAELGSAQVAVVSTFQSVELGQIFVEIASGAMPLESCSSSSASSANKTNIISIYRIYTHTYICKHMQKYAIYATIYACYIALWAAKICNVCMQYMPKYAIYMQIYRLCMQ